MTLTTFKRALDTTATPAVIWNIWTDTATWNTWNPDVQSVHLDGPFASGVTGTMTTKSGGTHRIRIEGVEAGRSFRLETAAMPLTRFVFRCEIAPSGSGRTEISQSITMEGPLAPIFSRMAGNQIANSFPALLRGLAAAAESAPGGR
jgi:Polyketide cyclase / dehydrase and lipid transport